MIRLGRLTYGVGALTFVIIGLTHLVAHALDLTGEPLQSAMALVHPIPVAGQIAHPWDMFQGFSILIGAFSAAIGLANLGTLLSVQEDRVPHPMASIANIGMLAVIATVGAFYLTAFQLIGGLIGIILYSIPLIAAFRTPRP